MTTNSKKLTFQHHHFQPVAQSSTSLSESMNDELSIIVLDDNNAETLNVNLNRNNKINKSTRKCFLIDSLLEERQKKLTVAGFAGSEKEDLLFINNSKQVNQNKSEKVADANFLCKKETSELINFSEEYLKDSIKLSMLQLLDNGNIDCEKLKKLITISTENQLPNSNSPNNENKGKRQLLATQIVEDSSFFPADPSPSVNALDKFISCLQTNPANNAAVSTTQIDLDLQNQCKKLKNQTNNSSDQSSHKAENEIRIFNLVFKILSNNMFNNNPNNASEKFFKTNAEESQHIKDILLGNELNEDTNRILNYMIRLKILQSTFGFANAMPFGGDNTNLQHYHQILHMIAAESSGQFLPIVGTWPYMPAALQKNLNSLNTNAASIFFNQKAVAATIAYNSRFNSSVTNTSVNQKLKLPTNNVKFSHKKALNAAVANPIINNIQLKTKCAKSDQNGDNKEYSKITDNKTLVSASTSSEFLKPFGTIKPSNALINGVMSIGKKTLNTSAPIHRSSNVKKYRCDICDKTFSRSNTLITHKRIHTGEKPFRCENCGRSFRQPGNLTRHAYTHTTVKPFVCTKCGKAFNRASNLHTHMRVHNSHSLGTPSGYSTMKNSCQQNKNTNSFLFNYITSASETETICAKI